VPAGQSRDSALGAGLRGLNFETRGNEGGEQDAGQPTAAPCCIHCSRARHRATIPAVTPEQRTVIQTSLASLAASSRGAGLSDQQMAEWLLGVGARWLVAHGVPKANVHQWVEFQLTQRGPIPAPLTAAARARNDFGGDRR
jgi:hypothetical protein